MKKIKFVYFDLDHTLWDFDKNSKNAMNIIYRELIEKHDKNNIGFINFFNTYDDYNQKMWDLYRKKEISKSELKYKRFKDVFDMLEIDLSDEEIKNLDDIYLKKLSMQKELHANVTETLDYLYKKYSLGILTNGFVEVQHKKMESSGIEKYFKIVITSEESGTLKPDRKIFDYAAEKCGIEAKNIVYIGDDLQNDIIAAKNAGFQGIYFNYRNTAYDKNITAISNMSEIRKIL
ncbi:MAG TPA: YjjG family noncanonical pyrimidine nucleotidase [Tepiditoga sp.]|nr:noncanonical pyrimidine nucleotidase, YjjG family [Thermotogota bacterium]HOO74414.1 YjjG family noncanonical pyrimidine nucleotidase [Tepiditoga sp.]